MGLMVKKSNVGGSGVFTSTAIAKGDLVYKLEGNIVNFLEIRRLIESGAENNDDPLQIGDDAYIDLNEFSRSFNHSCEPNVGFKGKSTLYALRNIKAHEEIRFDYSTTVAPNKIHWSMPCKCGAPACRKSVGTVASIPNARLDEYRSLKVLPNWIDIQLLR